MKTLDPVPLRWTLGAAWATILATLAAVTAPAIAAAVLAALAYLCTFALRARAFLCVQFAAAAGVLMAVPVLRLTAESNSLKLAVPAIVLVTAAAVAVRVRPRMPAGLVWLLLVFFLLDAWATANIPDSNEWSFWALAAAVAFAGVIFASAAAKLDAWPALAKTLILLTVAEALLAMGEVMFLSEPLWRGGRILSDGSSVWIRNELVASIPRAQGTFGHPLPLAFCLILGAILLVRTKAWHGAFRFLLFLVLAGGVFVSGSRNAIILFIGLSLLAFILPSFLARMNLVGPLVTAGLILAFPFLLEKYDELISSGSVGHRLGALEAVPTLMSDARSFTAVLIGDGSASSPRLYSQGLLQSDGFQAVDNQYVLTLAQNGLFGLLILVAVLVAGFAKGSATLRLLLIGVAASGMIFDLFAWPVTGFLVWFFVAAAWARMPSTAPTPRLVDDAEFERRSGYRAGKRGGYPAHDLKQRVGVVDRSVL